MSPKSDSSPRITEVAPSIEVLVAALMAETTIVSRMNIQTDALIVNQCDDFGLEEIAHDHGRRTRIISCPERGVGLSRNTALMRATADICVIADDDQAFVAGYPELVRRAFARHPKADVILFNLIERPPIRFVARRAFRVGYHNYQRFGAARIAFRRSSVCRAGVFFHLEYGGGTGRGGGEDTFFLHECLRKGLRLVAVPVALSEIHTKRCSTWFRGYNEKYFEDKGRLYRTLSKRLATLLCLQFTIRHQRRFRDEISWRSAFSAMLRGTR